MTLAVLLSDVHLCHTAPTSRSAEPDWYKAMGRVLDQVDGIQTENGGCPVIIAGDLFDKWHAPSELVNWAIDRLRNFGDGLLFAIPGQHDLPQHNYADIKRSAYWTLVMADVISNLPPGKTQFLSKGFYVTGFPWGFDIDRPTLPEGAAKVVQLAVVHEYIWDRGFGYVNAPESNRVSAFAQRLQGYTSAVFGDNHKGFLTLAGRCCVLNSGGLMRRTSDEIDYKPSVGLLQEDGDIDRVFLDVSEDRWTDEAVRKHEKTDATRREQVEGFLDELRSLVGEDLDYREAVRRAATHCKPAVGKLLLDSIGG